MMEAKVTPIHLSLLHIDVQYLVQHPVIIGSSSLQQCTLHMIGRTEQCIPYLILCGREHCFFGLARNRPHPLLWPTCSVCDKHSWIFLHAGHTLGTFLRQLEARAWWPPQSLWECNKNPALLCTLKSFLLRCSCYCLICRTSTYFEEENRPLSKVSIQIETSCRPLFFRVSVAPRVYFCHTCLDKRELCVPFISADCTPGISDAPGWGSYAL